MSILEKINSPSDLKALDEREIPMLSADIRSFLINNISKTGGHLASNLGIVELTIAIHRVFDTSRDRLVFDVGHQCYVHKLLTGRKGFFETLRSFGGISGYPVPSESEHDAFIAGHASNSVSVALGMARARTLLKQEHSVVAILGDGALTGGLAYEGLNNAGQSGEPLIIILNDNGMSITANVGGIAKYLSRQRLKPYYFSIKKAYRKITHATFVGKHIYRFTHRMKQKFKYMTLGCGMFEDMGFTYLGPVDGHDVKRIAYLLRQARQMKCPVLLHATTIKGKGYGPSEENPDEFHGISCFDIKSGYSKHVKDFSAVFGETMTELAATDERLCAITAAMCPGTGLTGFSNKFPNRFFDVGIAEGHAVSMSAGMAKAGLMPVFAVYSSFLQRSYDMLIHDAALQSLHIVLGVDRAGLVPSDGATHQGIFDVGFLSTIPNVTILCPSSFAELRDMLKSAIYDYNGLVAVRYPRGAEAAFNGSTAGSKAAKLCEGGDVTIVTYGIMINNALEAAKLLAASGVSAEVIKLNVISEPDYAFISASAQKTGLMLVLEDCVSEGSVGQRLAANIRGVPRVMLKNIGQAFPTHGSVPDLQKCFGLDAQSIKDAIIGELRH